MAGAAADSTRSAAMARVRGMDPGILADSDAIPAPAAIRVTDANGRTTARASRAATTWEPSDRACPHRPPVR